MRNSFNLILVMLVAATQAEAGTVCGSLQKHDTCNSEGGCPRFFLKDIDRPDGANAYTIIFQNDTAQADAAKYVNQPGTEVCIQGYVGANGDPDLLEAASVTLFMK